MSRQWQATLSYGSKQGFPPLGEREGGFFDAWGRRRDKDDWSYTLTGEPALFADRGLTGHEFLADFNLYNPPLPRDYIAWFV